MSQIKETQLRYLEFINRENEKRHHKFDEEMYQYKLLQAGDSRAVEEAARLWLSDLPGKVNEDMLKNWKYIFVASITLACRHAIMGGLEEERSYNISDLYIQRMDQCRTKQEIDALHADMFSFYVKEVAAAKTKTIYSRPVIMAMDYIYYHLHEKLTGEIVAGEVGLSANYLAALFKKELNLSVSDYILSRRIEAARNMLRFSSFPYGEIAEILAFSSQSHFVQVFKKQVGCTPKEYRTIAYREESEREIT